MSPEQPRANEEQPQPPRVAGPQSPPPADELQPIRTADAQQPPETSQLLPPPAITAGEGYIGPYGLIIRPSGPIPPRPAETQPSSMPATKSPASTGNDIVAERQQREDADDPERVS